ncbi:MAG: EamA family transporter [Pseudorhodoplanes sp.]|nr:EamA family transporter [Pseudorhodoplanes sp.]
MDSAVFAAVLLGAACHAGWNVLIKLRIDPLAATMLVALAGGLVALALLPVTGLPARECWPWLLLSILTHLFYFVGLIESYRAGELAQVYPLARGSAPLMTAMSSALLLGERLAAGAWIGIAVLAAGVLLLSARGGRDLARIDRLSVGFALFTAGTICVYSLVDGIGGRASGNPLAYTLALFAGDGIVMALYTWARGGRRVFSEALPYWRLGLAGGLLQLVSYGIAIWAMTRAPIALVAALRESSVLFAALLAVLILKEPLRPARIVSALMIVAGMVLIRLA